MCFPALFKVVDMLKLCVCLHTTTLKFFSTIYVSVIAVHSEMILSSTVASKSLEDSISCAGLVFLTLWVVLCY